MKSTNKTLLALSLIGALIAGYAPASAADVVKLKFVGNDSRTAAWAWATYEKMAETVKNGTEGRVELEMYDPGQLVPFVQHLEAVRAGIMDIASVVPGYYQNEFALSSLWNYMYTFYPDAVTSSQMWQALYDQYMSLDYEKLDLECIGGHGWVVVAYDLFTVDRPIASMEDAKGLKLRSNSAAMNAIIESMGAIPVFMGGGQIPDALSKKMLNGTPMSDHWGEAINIWDYANPGYWTITGSFPQGVSCLAASTRPNTKWMKKVSPEDREVVGAAMRQWAIDIAEATDAASARFLEAAAAKGITISEWPESEKQRLVDAWKPLMSDAMDFAKREGAPAQYMLDAMHQWLEDNK